MPDMHTRTVRRALVGVLAAAWLALGFLSDSVPEFNEPVWVVACSAAAGSAIALAKWTTRYALARYTAIAAAIGVARSASYAHDGAWGPAMVWLILLTTTVVAALALYAHPEMS